MYDTKAKASSPPWMIWNDLSVLLVTTAPGNCTPAFPRVQERTSLSSSSQHTHLMLDSSQLKNKSSFHCILHTKFNLKMLTCSRLTDIGQGRKERARKHVHYHVPTDSQ